MGTSVPAEPRWAPDVAPAEVALWRSCVEQLPDRVLVLPQVVMTVGEHGRVEEAEADLVLLDPDHGLTVVEVKGGTLSYDATQAIWRRREAGAREVRDPVAQVKRARSVLLRALKARGVDTSALAVRWAVATPDCRLDAPGEPVLRDAHVGRAGRRSARPPPRADLRAAVDRRAAARHRVGRPPRHRPAGSQPTGPCHVGAGRRRARGAGPHPHRVAPQRAAPLRRPPSRAGPRRCRDRQDHPRDRGGAAARLARAGVLLGCWNVVLGRWMRESLRAQLADIGSPLADEVTDDPTGRIVVADVAALARHGTVSSPGGDLSRWFHEQLPEALTPQVTGGEFDVVVLDEAQDLSELWVLAVSSLVARDGRWFAFADHQQAPVRHRRRPAGLPRRAA